MVYAYRFMIYYKGNEYDYRENARVREMSRGKCPWRNVRERNVQRQVLHPLQAVGTYSKNYVKHSANITATFTITEQTAHKKRIFFNISSRINLESVDQTSISTRQAHGVGYDGIPTNSMENLWEWKPEFADSSSGWKQTLQECLGYENKYSEILAKIVQF